MPLHGSIDGHSAGGSGENRCLNAALALAELLEKRTGAFVDAAALIEFFRTDWSKISTCAHIIHRENQIAAKQGDLTNA